MLNQKSVLQTNLPYILWIAGFNTSFLLGYLLLDLYFFPSPLVKSHYDPTSKLKHKVPASSAVVHQLPTEKALATSASSSAPSAAHYSDAPAAMTMRSLPPISTDEARSRREYEEESRQEEWRVHQRQMMHLNCSPPLLEAINKNSLVIFLVVCNFPFPHPFPPQ